MSADDDTKSYPKSMRHKQILDVAEANPDASIDELASEVPSATAELVERVLEEHGDPASETDQQTDAAPDTDAKPTPSDDEAQGPEPADSKSTLPEKHHRLLEAIADRPEATQEELATQFDVTSATISRWASEIDGFQWEHRESFVRDSCQPETATDDVLSKETPAEEQTQTDSLPVDDGRSLDEILTNIETELTQLNERLDRFESAATADSDDSAFDDPELVHKVVHACLDSEAISESEELRILEALLS